MAQINAGRLFCLEPYGMNAYICQPDQVPNGVKLIQKVALRSTKIGIFAEVYQGVSGRLCRAENGVEISETAGDNIQKTAILKAFEEFSLTGVDICGDQLHWHLIGEYKNAQAAKLKKAYKAKFALLPTIDHKNANPEPDFIICSWKFNDAKNDLSFEQFKELCINFLKNQNLSLLN